MLWNYRGLANKGTIFTVRRLINKHQPHCILLIETKGNVQRLEPICRKLGYQNIERADARGTTSGLLLMWNDEIQMELIWKNYRVLCCHFTNPITKNN